MRLSNRTKRMIVHQERNRAGVSLNLIPMIDILSVMVAFLLVYSTEVEVLQNTKGITIPESVAEQKPRVTVVIMVTPDPQTCQLVTTVTRIGKSLYDPGAHGEAGVTVQLDPPLPPVHGPVYFNADVIPDLSLSETSDDGGVVYTNVPPGEYTLVGSKDGATFTAVRFKCEAGWLVNASPPWGIQRLE